MSIVKFQKLMIPKMYREESRVLWSACQLMMCYISMTFQDPDFND